MKEKTSQLKISRLRNKRGERLQPIKWVGKKKTEEKSFMTDPLFSYLQIARKY